tara:strand:- start:14 stop:196 length:183 start_codon:yes stop_codon:yes gene_type:complete
MSTLSKKSEKELMKDLLEKRKAIREFRFNIAGSKLKDIKEGRALKRDVARILTELNARNK